MLEKTQKHTELYKLTEDAQIEQGLSEEEEYRDEDKRIGWHYIQT